MNGGPSTIDLWDLKPGHPHGGPFREIQTQSAGVKISEHLPRLARWSDHLAIVRSLTSREGDHERATHLMRTGYAPQGAIQFPWFGALAAQGQSDPARALPSFVSIAPGRPALARRAGGFLGAAFNPLILADNEDGSLEVPNLNPLRQVAYSAERLQLLDRLNTRFLQNRTGNGATSIPAATRAAHALHRDEVARIFDLTLESDHVRSAYGQNRFGQGLLLARRLIENQVPFIDVTLGGWDSHSNNFTQVENLARTFDHAWSALLQDLQDRSLLEHTVIAWMGEFGRTPRINGNAGRDHWPRAFSAVLAGGGIAGGQVYGATTDDGTAIADRPATIPDFLATLCHAIGIDPLRQNLSNVSRPIRVVDPSARPLREVLA